VKTIAYLIAIAAFIGMVFCVVTLQWNGVVGLLATSCMIWLLGSIADKLSDLERDVAELRKEPPTSLVHQLQDLRHLVMRVDRAVRHEPEPPPTPSRPPAAPPPTGPRSCARRGEKQEEQFTACWQCKTPRGA
jgi:hypothetical protein